MKILPALLVALALPACWGPHIVTGSAPTSPAATYDCMVKVVADLGYTVTQSDSTTGFLAAEKRDLNSPDSAEFSELTIAVYKDRDGHTQFTTSAGRSRIDDSGQRSSTGVFVQDADNKAADTVIRRCVHQ